MPPGNPGSAETSLYPASVQRALSPTVPQSSASGKGGTFGNMLFTTEPESIPHLGTPPQRVRPGGPREWKSNPSSPQALAKGPLAQPHNQPAPQSPDRILTPPDGPKQLLKRRRRVIRRPGGSNARQSSHDVTTDAHLSYPELGKGPESPPPPRQGHVGGLGFGPQNSAGVGDVSNILGVPYANSRNAAASSADANRSPTIHAPTPVRPAQMDKSGKSNTVRLLEGVQETTDQGAATS